jgi:hypothetical protein
MLDSVSCTVASLPRTSTAILSRQDKDFIIIYPIYPIYPWSLLHPLGFI